MIYINREALVTIENEIIKYSNSETGGIFLGYYLNNDVVITHAFVSRGNSVKKPTLFKKDLHHSKRLQSKYYRKYGTHFLGDWHKHPNNDTQCSLLDKASILISSLINKRQLCFMIVGDAFQKDKKYMSIYSLAKQDFSIYKNEYTIIENIEDFIFQNKMNLT